MQRYCLENKRLALLKKTGRNPWGEGAGCPCLSALQDLEEIDPYDEAAAERRIGILIEQGNYNEAVRYYQNFYNKLAVDIGVQPSDALKRLIRGIGKRKHPALLSELKPVVCNLSTASGCLMCRKQLMEEGSLCFKRLPFCRNALGYFSYPAPSGKSHLWLSLWRSLQMRLWN